MVNDEVRRALDELYSTMPTVECQGHCWNSCGPVSMSSAERERIEEMGVQIEAFTPERSAAWKMGAELHCAALTKDRRCAVYEIRPLICRAWGVGRGEMACTHGCKVTGRRLRATEILMLLVRAEEISGVDVNEAWGIPPEVIYGDPAVAKLLARYIAGEWSIEPELTRAARAAAIAHQKQEPAD